MKHTPLFYATVLALTTATISGTSNFLNKIAVTVIKDPIFFTVFKNSLVALLLVGILIIIKKRHEIASLKKGQIFKLLAVGFFGGSIPFALYFTGLQQTSALSASLIHKTLFIWVLIFAIPILKERIFGWQWLGIAAIFSANLFLGGFAGFKYNIGELMILGATILWGVENIIAKIILKDVASSIVAAARFSFGTLLLLPIFFFHNADFAIIGKLTFEQWGWTTIVVLTQVGFILTWYSALKRAPATYVATLLVPATLVTNILSAVFVTHAFSGRQALSLALFLIGVILVVLFARKTAEQAAATPPPLELKRF